MTIAVTGVRPARSLEELIAQATPPLIRRLHLNRDWIIGLIGSRGSGKSLGGANIALRDFMFRGDPCFSNMDLKLKLRTPWGTVVYEAEPLNRRGLLQLDSRYEDSVLFVDEINIEYGESRRSTSNVNLLSARLIQQLRKFRAGLIYTAIDEMYVDVRIRENTDIFIYCHDTAFDTHNLLRKQPQGHVFNWLLYPVTERFLGSEFSYKKTRRAIGPFTMRMNGLWGVIPTEKRQGGQGKYSDLTEKRQGGQGKYSDLDRGMDLMQIVPGESPAIREHRKSWMNDVDEAVDEWMKNYKDGEVVEWPCDLVKKQLGVPDNYWSNVASYLRKKIPSIERKGKGTKTNPAYFRFTINRVGE